MMGFYFIGGIGRAAGNGLYTILNPTYIEAIYISTMLYVLTSILVDEISEGQRRGTKGGEKGSYDVFDNPHTAFAIGYMWGTLSEILIVYIKEVYIMGRTQVTELLFYGYLIGAGLGLFFGKVSDKVGSIAS